MHARWPALRRFWGLLPRTQVALRDLAPRQLLAPAPRPPREQLLTVRALAGAAPSGGARAKQVYRCRECGEESLQWTGFCRSCKAVDTWAEWAGAGRGWRAAWAV